MLRVLSYFPLCHCNFCHWFKEPADFLLIGFGDTFPFYQDLKWIHLFTAKCLEVQLSGNKSKNIFIYIYVCLSVITEIWSSTHPRTNPCSILGVSCPAVAFSLTLCCGICSFGLEPFLQHFALNCIRDLLCFPLKPNLGHGKAVMTVSSSGDVAHEGRPKWRTNYEISAVTNPLCWGALSLPEAEFWPSLKWTFPLLQNCR